MLCTTYSTTKKNCSLLFSSKCAICHLLLYDEHTQTHTFEKLVIHVKESVSLCVVLISPLMHFDYILQQPTSFLFPFIVLKTRSQVWWWYPVGRVLRQHRKSHVKTRSMFVCMCVYVSMFVSLCVWICVSSLVSLSSRSHNYPIVKLHLMISLILVTFQRSHL